MSSLEKIDMPKRSTTVGLLATLFSPVTSTPAVAQQPAAPKNSTPENGAWVKVNDILDQQIPNSYIASLNEKMAGKTGIIISKKYNLFFLYNGGSQPVRVGVAMHANPGYKVKNKWGEARTPESPEGRPFLITRKEDWNYKSRETVNSGVGEAMYNAMFYRELDVDGKPIDRGDNGRAIHGSDNFQTINGVEMVKYNNSHGCINVSKADIIEISKILMKGHPIIIQD